MSTENEQKLVDICFSIGLILHDKQNRRRFNKMDQEELAGWIAKQLQGCGFETFPCGSSWGILKK